MLLVLLGACFWLVRRARGSAGAHARCASTGGRAAAGARPGATASAGCGLALVPSALLTAFTTHVATDIASAPLLWVMPLALYLLTFVLVFRERALDPAWSLLLPSHLAAVIFALLAALADASTTSGRSTSAAGVAVFFTSALVAHRTLYEARPARALSDRVLYVDVARRRAGRAVRGADRAEALLGGVRVSAAARAHHGLPAGRASASRCASASELAVACRLHPRRSAGCSSHLLGAVGGGQARAHVRRWGVDARAGARFRRRASSPSGRTARASSRPRC